MSAVPRLKGTASTLTETERFATARKGRRRPHRQRLPMTTSTPIASVKVSRDRPKLTPVEALPRRQRPLWLRLLGWGQAGSVLVTTGLVGSVFVLYGLTVQTNRQLSTATRQLQTLQTQAQQLVTGKAILRHHLLKQTAAGGITQPRQGVIFLEPEAAPEVAVPSTAPPAPQPILHTRPLGY